MKIIHCADLHLDSKMTTHLPVEKARQRRRELLATFQTMVEFAAGKSVSAIIIAGDMFDSQVLSTGTRNFVVDTILKNQAIDFYYLRGNHDSDSFLSSLDEYPDNLRMFNDTWTSYPANRKGNIKITGLELDQTNFQTMYDSLNLQSEDFNIVVLHGQISQSQNVSDYENINLKALQYKNIDYLALGHLHSMQIGQIDPRGTYCYAGCLEARGFDECGEHGFMLLDIDEQSLTYRHQFIPLGFRAFHQKEVDITGIRSSSQIVDRIKEMIVQEQIPEKDILKILLVGKVEVDAEKDIEMIKSQFRNRFYFFKIYDQSDWQVDYHEFALEKSLKGEFIRMVQAQDMMEEEKARIIQVGIRALRGEELE